MKEILGVVKRRIGETWRFPRRTEAPGNLQPEQLTQALSDYQKVAKCWGIVIGIGAGLTADLWPANPHLATLGILLSTWGFASFMDARREIISLLQEAQKRGFSLKGRTFVAKRIKP